MAAGKCFANCKHLYKCTNFQMAANVAEKCIANASRLLTVK
jgi:hypothetical protein